MASSDPWLEFEQIRHNIKNNTVDRLKQILSGLNDDCATHFSKSGKKQEIIDRIVSTLDTWRAANLEDKWLKAKAVVYQVRNTGIYTPNRTSVNPAILPTSTIPHNPYTGPGISKPPYLPTTAGSSGVGRYDPYVPLRKVTTSSVPTTSSSSQIRPPYFEVIRFKESPFFHIEQAVSAIMECPESNSATDRRQQTVTFTLSQEHIDKLKSPGLKYQLRLFCTSSIFYSGSNTFRSNAVPCPIEFPPTCEVRVNNVLLTANLKGLKKKPGTAPPPDLGKYARLSMVQNRVEMIYVNSQQPVQAKKYHLIVMLIEATTVDRLVSNLKTTSYRSSQDIRQKMIESMTEDDDIVAGPQKMSLKCPLSFMRINTPCRSSKCVHCQCFDATSWFSVMEQTTTWLCPVCERVLDCKDLIIDGYFDEILKQCPESVEDVVVEADGEWHTSDNKYGSTSWRAIHPVSIVPDLAAPRKPPVVSSPSRPPPKSDTSGKGKADSQEIFVVDSDDEEESQVKRELSPAYGSGSPANDGPAVSRTQPETHSSDIIDLTLDSDDDESPVQMNAGKRKAADTDLNSTSPTEQIWKKGRIDPDRSLAAAVLRGPASNGPHDVDYSSTHLNLSRSGPPLRYPLLYQGTTLPVPPSYPQYSARGSASSNTPQLLPGITSLLPGGSRWP